ncbi:MAG: VWA domain-containing protein [bacterium]|nr:VWA domain-containing protein [bacterium]
MHAYAHWMILLALAAPATALADSAAYHDAVVIVLDGSGSMDGSMRDGTKKMNAAKQALKQVLAQVPETTHVGLLAFSGNVNGWAYELGPLQKQRLLGAIDGIRENGGTPLGDYVKLGADRLLEERGKQFGYGTYRLLVVTDGEETGSSWVVNDVAPQVTARGVTLDVIGVAMDSDHSLKQHATAYRSADDPASLQRAVAQTFAEVSATGDGSAPADAVFADLEGLEPEAASAMISAFAAVNNANWPIGEAPPEPAPDTGSTFQPIQGVGGVGIDAGCGGCQSSGRPVGVLISIGMMLFGFALMRRSRN